MERRQFLTGLAGLAGLAAFAAAMPRQANALPTDILTDATPQEGGILPELKAAQEEISETEGVEVAQHHGRHRRHGYRRHHHHYGPPRRRRRRVRRRHYRRVCNRYRNRWGEWVRRCRREPVWSWIWI